MATADTYRRLRIEPVRSVHGLPVRTHQIDCADYRPDWGNCAPLVGPPAARVHYECLQCDQRWAANVGPTECPGCGCAYVQWLNR